MMNILIDTCVVIHILRSQSTGKNCSEALEKFDKGGNIIASVVTKAEILSLAKQNNWGNPKLEKLNSFFSDITFIDISGANCDLIDAYITVDAYSKKKDTR